MPKPSPKQTRALLFSLKLLITMGQREKIKRASACNKLRVISTIRAEVLNPAETISSGGPDFRMVVHIRNRCGDARDAAASEQNPTPEEFSNRRRAYCAVAEDARRSPAARTLYPSLGLS